MLLVASATDEEWIEGGYEFTFEPNQVSMLADVDAGCMGCDVPSTIIRKATAPGMLGATIHREFLLGLDAITIETQFNMRFTNEAVQQDCVFPLGPWLRDINAAAASNNTSPWNRWQGMQPIKESTFQATLGLVGFACFLQVVAWLAMVLVQYQSPFVSESLRTLWLVRVLAIGSVFFAIVALLVFGTAPIKKEFCAAFDPDAAFNGLPCGWGNGFNVCVAAVVFGVLQALAAWFYMPMELPQAYTFSKQGQGAGVVGFASTAYEPSGSSSSSSALASNAYNADGASAPSSSSGSGFNAGGYNAIGQTTDL